MGQNPFLRILLGIALIALLAQLTLHLDWQELQIPITGQSLAVLLVGYVLGRPWGGIAILAYLLLGGLGLPIFADGGSGWDTFSKGSAGFLYGFVLGAWLIGWCREGNWGRRWDLALGAMGLGTAAIIALGLLYLNHLYGWEKALLYGWYPFWPGALIKIAIGAGIIWWMHRTAIGSKILGIEE